MDDRFDNWRKSERSGEGNGGCVEVGSMAGTMIGVRDTKAHGQGPILAFGANHWTTFLGVIRSDDLTA